MNAGRSATTRDAETTVASLRALLVPPSRRRLALLVLGAALLGVVLWVVGMDAWHASTIGGGIVAAGLIWLAAPDHSTPEWTDDDAEESGARTEVRRLSWALQPRRWRVRAPVLERVRGIARDRLAVQRLDLDDPQHAAAITVLLGGEAYRILRDDGEATVPLRSVVHVVDRLEALDQPPTSERDTEDLPGRRTSNVR